MAKTWSTLLLTCSLVWVLLVRQCRLQSGGGSADPTLGDDDQNLDHDKTTQVLTVAAASYISKNSSDLYMARDAVRDDHEVIENIRRLKNQKLRILSKKNCLRRCQRRNPKCYQQITSNQMNGKTYCDVCVALCRDHPETGR